MANRATTDGARQRFPLRKRLHETLQNFDQDFPNHPNTLNVFLMIAEMALKIYKDSGTGTLFLQRARDYDKSV
ncbi:MAG: hypothetical protein P8J55_10175 [Pseudomonadales bacterium]|jgi:hypothetical protein|nr:hypothetical protein [Pseudomonadales bacterium]